VSASKKAKPRSGGARSKKVLPASRRKAWSAGKMPAALSKPINDIWWCGVHPQGYAVWGYLDLTQKNVTELLTREQGKYWAERGWRIAKLQVTELTQ